VQDEAAAGGLGRSVEESLREDRETESDGWAQSSAPDTPDLRGALPCDDSGEVGREPKASPCGAKRRVVTGGAGRIFGRWGPYKRWSMYRRFRREAAKDPELWRQRDEEENARGRLPDDEQVQVPAIWVAELYTPSTVGGLLAGIARLGWEQGRTRDDSLTKWMCDVREGRQAGSMSLGLVSSPKDPHLMRERTALLPEGVMAALPTLMSITPSVTGLVVGFLLDETFANLLDEPLRATFSTRGDPLFRFWHVARYVFKNGPVRLGHNVLSPDLIRRDRLRSCMRELERRCIAWVHQHIPGVFAARSCSSFPTAVLYITEKTPPLTAEASGIRAFRGISIDRDFVAWESLEWPGARLVLADPWDDEDSRLVFACRRRDAVRHKEHYPDPESNWTIAQHADDLVRGLLLRWSLSCLLDGYHERLSALRDRTARTSVHRPVHDLKELRALARTSLYDIAACAQEIGEFVESDQAYRHDVLEMAFVRQIRGERPDMLRGLQESQGRRSRQVQRESDLLQSTLSIINDLSKGISNTRIQRLLVLLTGVSVAAALWAVYLSLKA
jgi:hypothetical protein